MTIPLSISFINQHHRNSPACKATPLRDYYKSAHELLRMDNSFKNPFWGLKALSTSLMPDGWFDNDGLLQEHYKMLLERINISKLDLWYHPSSASKDRSLSPKSLKGHMCEHVAKVMLVGTQVASGRDRDSA